MTNKRKTSRRFQVIAIFAIMLLVLKAWDGRMVSEEDRKVEFLDMRKKIRVEDREIYYDEIGNGTPTVVLLSGSGVSSSYADMYSLRNLLSANYRVLTVDRPGMGRSSDTDEKRDIDTLVRELDRVLRESEGEGPYLLVAHSMSGLQAIRYAQLHPDATYGIVFVDAASPEFCRHFKDPMKNTVHLLKWARQTGILRAISVLPGMDEAFHSKQELPPDIREFEKNVILRRLWNSTMINERKEMRANAEIVARGGDLGDIPVRVISAGNNGLDGWLETQEDLLYLSADSTGVVLDDAGHFVHHESPEIIVDQIDRLIQRVNGKKSSTYNIDLKK